MAVVSLRALALRRFLTLPSPLLRLASGGLAVYRGGRTLDPRLQVLAGGGLSLAEMSPADARQAIARRRRLLPHRPISGVTAEAVSASGPVPALRIYRPSAQDPKAPMLVFAHGGGGVLGDLDASDGLCRILAQGLRAPVVSVEYRLAPECRFPAGFEDFMAACLWANDAAPAYGAPAGEIMVGGEGIGGTFAAALCQALKDAGKPQPTLQILLYPWIDLSSETPSMTTYADAFPLSRTTLTWLAGHYLGPQDDPGDSRVSPLRTTELCGLAPAVVATAGFDPLVDQGEAYAKALEAAGTPVTYRSYDSLTHGFAAFAGAVPAAEAACREIAVLGRVALEARIS